MVAVVEALDNGKSIRETRDADTAVVIRHLYHYAGWAQLMSEEMSAWQSVGVIGAIVPWNFPLMLLVWKVAPALAMGNTVVLKPATYTRLSALLFAEICAEAGLPAGVFNVVTGGGAMGQILAEHALVDKVRVVYQYYHDLYFILTSGCFHRINRDRKSSKTSHSRNWEEDIPGVGGKISGDRV